MQMKKWYKIVSIISAIAMLLSCFSGVAVVSAEDTAVSAMPDIQALFEEVISVSNDTTQDDIAKAKDLVDAQLETDAPEYVMGEIKSYYKMDAIGGAYEIGSANGGSSYTGAPVNDEVLVEGIDGYVSFVVGVQKYDEATDTNIDTDVVVTLKIDAPMEGYTFTSCSNDILHWSGDNTSGWSYTQGTNFEKVVVPDEITKLNESFSWKGDSGIRCIIYGKGLTSIPRMLSTRSVEVIGFKGELTSLPGNAFDGWGSNSKLKYIRIPETVTSLGSKVFQHSPNLVGLYLPEGLVDINGSIVYNYADAAGGMHSWSNITIPSTANYIAENAFAGASVPCEVTILSKSNNLWNANVFYNSETPELGNNYSIRVFKSTNDGSADKNYAVATEAQKTYIDDTITIAEVVARAARQANIAGDKTYADADTALADTANVLTKIKGASGNVDGYTVEYANTDWEVGISSISNAITVSDGTNTTTIDVVLSFVYEGFSGEITVNNATTENSLKAQLEEATGATVEITDFYKIKSMPEVVEVNSTYAGAINGQILVPGETGYVSAYYTVTDANGATSESNVLLRIAPERVERTYNTVSNEADWVETEEGSGVWKYAGGAVDKLVVPDKVTALLSGYWPNWYSSTSFNCVVFGTGLTSLPNCGYLPAEVVSFKGNNIKSIGAAFYSASNLAYIHLPEGLESIGGNAFRWDTKLEYLYIPESVTSIGGNLFYHFGEDNNEDGTLNTAKAHNLTEVTIPVNVKGIGYSGLAGAAKDFTITVISRHNDSSWNIIYDDTVDKSIAENITLRAYKNTAIQIYNEVVNPVEILDDTMGKAEIRARAQQAADKYADETYDSVEAVTAAADGFLTSIKNSYNNGSYTAAWKNADWSADNGFLYSNTAVITVGADTVEVPFSVKKSGEFDLQALVNEQGVTVDNYTTKAVLAEKLAEIGLDNYDIDIIDFYKLNAYNGAVEVTANGNEVLVPGEDGYLAAIVKITGNNGSSVVSNLLLKIDAKMEEYTFSTVSNSINDWKETEEGSGVWYYNGGNVDKLIIPDEVKAFNTHWFNWKHIKCVVYGKGTTGTGSCSWNSTLEVVVLSDTITNISGWSFKSASNLKYIYIPESVETINDQAFKGCTSLETIKLPGNLKTIGRNAFAQYNEEGTNIHNLTQLEIPASVTTIRENAFNGAANPFEITILGKSVPVNATAFYNEANVAEYGETANYQNNIVRVYKDSVTDTNTVTVEGNKLYIDEMTVAEAAARTAKFADEVSDEILTDVSKLETRIGNANLNAASISLAWGADEWTESGNNVSNVLTLSDGTNTFDVDVTMLAPTGFYADGAEILDVEGWKANNYKQGLRFFSSYKSTAADKVEIDGTEYTIKDFGILIKHIANDSASAAGAIMDDASFVIGAAGVITESGAEGTVTRNDDTNKNQFSVYVKNIPQGGRDYAFQSRGYITYTDAQGNDVTVYTDSQVTTPKAEFSIVSADTDYAAMQDWFDGKIS